MKISVIPAHPDDGSFNHAIVFNTSNTELEREKKVFGDPLETIWKNCIFGLCGVPNFYRRMFGAVVTSTEIQRREWLAEIVINIDTFFPANHFISRRIE